jgi:hypothetical protein
VKCGGFAKSWKTPSSVIPAKAGIQCFHFVADFLDPGACPEPDPGFAGVTTLVTFCKCIK